MLFAISYDWRATTTGEDTKRLRRLFVAWNPPTETEIVVHYHYARGGGILFVETSSAAHLYRALAPFMPILEFDIEPALNVIGAIAISMDVEEWVEGVHMASDLKRSTGNE